MIIKQIKFWLLFLRCLFTYHNVVHYAETGCCDSNGKNFKKLSNVYYCTRCRKTVEVESNADA